MYWFSVHIKVLKRLQLLFIYVMSLLRAMGLGGVTSNDVTGFRFEKIIVRIFYDS